MSEPSRQGGRNPTLALVVIAAAQLMVVLDATIVNVALPHIQGAPSWARCSSRFR